MSEIGENVGGGIPFEFRGLCKSAAHLLTSRQLSAHRALESDVAMTIEPSSYQLSVQQASNRVPVLWPLPVWRVSRGMYERVELRAVSKQHCCSEVRAFDR